MADPDVRASGLRRTPGTAVLRPAGPVDLGDVSEKRRGAEAVARREPEAARGVRTSGARGVRPLERDGTALTVLPLPRRAERAQD